MLPRHHAKVLLKKRGWSYRRAAPLLGVTYVHLAKVLSGVRESARLLAKIEALPDSPDPYRDGGFAATPFRRAR